MIGVRALHGILLSWLSLMAASDQMRTVQVGSAKRSFILHVPPQLRSAAGLPLVIVLHGGRSGPEDVEQLTGFSSLADTEHFLVAYPKALGANWNDGRASTQAAQPDQDDVQFIDALIDTLGTEFKINAGEIYLTGISNGAMACHRIGCELANKISAIAGVSGGVAARIATGCSPARPLSVLGIYGTADPIVPWGGGEVKRGARGKLLGGRATTKMWADLLGCKSKSVHTELDVTVDDGTSVWREVYGNCASSAEVVLYAVEGGGHAWPGREIPRGGPLFRALLGKSSKNLNATEVIWQFFSRTSRRAQLMGSDEPLAESSENKIHSNDVDER